ncbi:MAG: AtpZ/AtpI family protein [Dehalococcoidia bacterium]
MRGLPTTVKLLGLGWYIAFCIMAGAVGGGLIDGAAGTRPLFTVLGLLLGLLAALWGGYILLMETLGSRQQPRRKDG